ncbi:hypothetical protein OnM2_080039 [Erysiphe neolycopersici]|uniref:Chromo domain-containing protein n=1 Tax=Erysiphe neolycopersici TaxID=212602 RepID=A0A420HGR8_9PEZI|nr:hypothetical protein OnM2_080039 [Erysiphe neolycopersici]
MSPFFGNHGFRDKGIKNTFDPHQSATSPTTSPSTPIKKNNHLPKRSNSVKTTQDTSEAFHAHKISLGDSSLKSPTSTRKGSTIASYKVGDEVFLSTKSHVSVRPVRRFNQPYEGPFRITKVINSHFYQLKLPDELDPLHNCFHVSLLIPVSKDLLHNLTKSLPPLKATDSSEKPLWTVEKVVDAKRPDGKLYYIIRWRGAAEREKMWNPPPNLVTAIISEKSRVDGQIVTHKKYVILL